MKMMMQPMLCSPYNEATMKTHKAWMISEKYDGWRMVYIHGKFYTRAGNEIIPSDGIVDEMKRIDPLGEMMVDGELWLDYMRFDEIAGALQAKDEGLMWKVFDMPSVMGGFHTRYVEMLKVFGGCHHIDVVDQRVVFRKEEADHIFEDMMKDSMKEGIVLRPFELQYSWNSRPNDFMKRKRLQDMEGSGVLYHGECKGEAAGWICEQLSV
jgi:ATP-dependent DNA ligase